MLSVWTVSNRNRNREAVHVLEVCFPVSAPLLDRRTSIYTVMRKGKMLSNTRATTYVVRENSGGPNAVGGVQALRGNKMVSVCVGFARFCFLRFAVGISVKRISERLRLRLGSRGGVCRNVAILALKLQKC